MSKQFISSKFWKCALQVNPASYIAYRGTEQSLSEDEYNRELLRVAKENDIAVIGLADHGNVDGVGAIREIMQQHGIIVFPGFEIASSEKAHFVCLFDENTTRDMLIGIMAKLEIDPGNPTHPSKLSATQIVSKVDELDGFIYAAHCTDDNGVLNRKLHHVWRDAKLKSAQIPGTLEDLKGDSAFYKQILRNKTPDYKRDTPMVLINAKDVAHPVDLANPKASCLIKMTRPNFESFKLAFQDAESRVRLNSDVSDKYYSRIERFRVTGGYLDEVDLELSGHLNAIIGGRGTGKSTLIECIRYALGLVATSKNAQKQHQELIKENLGKSRARVELVVRSSQMNGKLFTIARRYGESPVVLDEGGNASAFKPMDVLPGIKIYGQNEIYEIAQDKASQRDLLSKFLIFPEQDEQTDIEENKNLLTDNSQQLVQVLNNIAQVQDEVSRLPKLEEQLGHYKTLGIEEKLKIVPLLEEEKLLRQTVADGSLSSLDKAFKSIEDSLSSKDFLSEEKIGHLPHSEILRSIRMNVNRVCDEAKTLLARWVEIHEAASQSIQPIMDELLRAIELDEASLEKTFRELPSAEGKSGKEIGIEYQTLVRQIEQIRPKQTLIQSQMKAVEQLMKDRKTVQDRLSQLRSTRAAGLLRQLKRLNKRLLGKIRLTLEPEADRTPVTKFIMSCKLDGIGEGRLAWIEEAEDFSVAKLAELIRTGVDALQGAGWGITGFMADSLCRLTPEQILRLEELELPDLFSIELNVAHEGPEIYKPLNKLSTGQQCTAVLHLLLLDDVDPLIMDQPEDNLDNAFIADRIVSELRSAKIARQFIFATHNANIPVFGDAEWIGVFEVQDGNARIPIESQGAVDVPSVRDKAANILEGGRMAFNQRKLKYGF